MEKDVKEMKLAVIMFVLIVFLSCTTYMPRKNEITKIEIATSGCYGTCQSTAISIDNNLNYKYYGGRYASLKGYYLGKVTKGFWDTLNMKLEHIKYKQMDTTYNVNIDLPETELIIHYNGLVKHIQSDFFRKPDSIWNVLNWLKNSYQKIKLHETKKKIQFQTKAQSNH